MKKEKKDQKIRATKNTAEQVEAKAKQKNLAAQLGELQIEIEKVAAFLQKLNQRKVQIMQEHEKNK